MSVQTVGKLVAEIIASEAVTLVVVERVSAGRSSTGIRKTLSADAGTALVSHVWKTVVSQIATHGNFTLKTLAGTIHTWCRLSARSSSWGSSKCSALQTRTGGRLNGSGIIAAEATAVVVAIGTVGPRISIIISRWGRRGWSRGSRLSHTRMFLQTFVLYPVDNGPVDMIQNRSIAGNSHGPRLEEAHVLGRFTN